MNTASPTIAALPIDAIEALHCPHCGYDLRASEGGACPECGGAIDRAALLRSQIPWVHRRGVGRIRAFWKTVWHVTFRTKRLAYEMSRPVDLGDAMAFRMAVIRWLLPFIVPFGLVPLFISSRTDLEDWGPLASIAWLCVLGLAVLTVLFLYALTGVHTYWFHPKSLSIERQNRAIALAYYACAPLAFLPFAAALTAIGVVAVSAGEDWRQPVVWWTGGALLLMGISMLAASPAAMWSVCLSIAQQATQRSGAGYALMAIAVPASWLALTVLLLGLVPGAVAYVCVIFRTL